MAETTDHAPPTAQGCSSVTRNLPLQPNSSYSAGSETASFQDSAQTPRPRPLWARPPHRWAVSAFLLCPAPLRRFCATDLGIPVGSAILPLGQLRLHLSSDYPTGSSCSCSPLQDSRATPIRIPRPHPLLGPRIAFLWLHPRGPTLTVDSQASWALGSRPPGSHYRPVAWRPPALRWLWLW